MAKKKKKKPQSFGVLIGGALVVVPGALPGLWGTFRKAVVEGYSISDGAAQSVFTVTMVCFGAACILTGLAGDKAGPKLVAGVGAALLALGFFASALLPQNMAKLLCITYGVPIGVGCACLYPTAMSSVQKLYPQRKGLATGVLGASLGISGAAIAYGGRALIKFTNIRICFAVLGAVLGTVVFTGAMLLKQPKRAPAQKAQTGKNFTPREMVLTRAYWLLFLTTFLAAPTTQFFSPRITEMGVQRGLSEGAAALSLALSSVANGAGRFTMPFLSDKFGRVQTVVASFVLLGCASAGLWWAQGYWLPVMYGVTTFFYSGQNAVMPAFCSDLFGLKHSGVNYGLVALGMTLGAVFFPVIANVYGEGDAPRHIIALVCACGGALTAGASGAAFAAPKKM